MYISGATVKDFIEVVKNMNDPTSYAKILIHIGTNDIRNDNKSRIVNNLKQINGINSTKIGSWTTIIFSGIILHQNNSRNILQLT